MISEHELSRDLPECLLNLLSALLQSLPCSGRWRFGQIGGLNWRAGYTPHFAQNGSYAA
jgi:hypothetical protein